MIYKKNQKIILILILLSTLSGITGLVSVWLYSIGYITFTCQGFFCWIFAYLIHLGYGNWEIVFYVISLLAILLGILVFVLSRNGKLNI